MTLEVFAETFRRDEFQKEVGAIDFAQENHSHSAQIGTVRGLHFQAQPRAQGKVVSCIRGAILDVAVDIRKGSPSYGQHCSLELNEDNGHQLWIPAGFAHGFVTLRPHTEIVYKVTELYSAEHDRGLAWNDPALAIDWGVGEAAILSDKDKAHPTLAELPAYFYF